MVETSINPWKKVILLDINYAKNSPVINRFTVLFCICKLSM